MTSTFKDSRAQRTEAHKLEVRIGLDGEARMKSEGREGEWNEKNKRREEVRKGEQHTPSNCRAQVQESTTLGGRVEEGEDEWERMHGGSSKCNSIAVHPPRSRAVVLSIQAKRRDIKLWEGTCKAYGVCDECEDMSLDTDKCARAGSCGACS
ncbi:hypothetical protein C8R45DRAFT_922870 [Mycena sanguinolenta]|nr:hypothetical protein C8R45DRAFT_922870 [Mycena sanguinolenta]